MLLCRRWCLGTAWTARAVRVVCGVSGLRGSAWGIVRGVRYAGFGVVVRVYPGCPTGVATRIPAYC